MGSWCLAVSAGKGGGEGTSRWLWGGTREEGGAVRGAGAAAGAVRCPRVGVRSIGERKRWPGGPGETEAGGATSGKGLRRVGGRARVAPRRAASRRVTPTGLAVELMGGEKEERERKRGEKLEWAVGTGEQKKMQACGWLNGVVDDVKRTGSARTCGDDKESR